MLPSLLVRTNRVVRMKSDPTASLHEMHSSVSGSAFRRASGMGFSQRMQSIGIGSLLLVVVVVRVPVARVNRCYAGLDHVLELGALGGVPEHVAREAQIVGTRVLRRLHETGVLAHLTLQF